MVERELHCLEDSIQLAGWLAERLSTKTVVLFQGEMGAGKTFLIRALCQHLGVSSRDLASPTYALHHSYVSRQGWQVEHWDLYRLADEDQLESSGFWDQFSDADRLVLVEWADRVPGSWWPLDWTLIQVGIRLQEDLRQIVITGLAES